MPTKKKRTHASILQRPDPQRHPWTHRYLTSGAIWPDERGELNGMAVDGEVCCVGSLYDLDTTERYLAERGPEDW